MKILVIALIALVAALIGAAPLLWTQQQGCSATARHAELISKLSSTIGNRITSLPCSHRVVLIKSNSILVISGLGDDDYGAITTIVNDVVSQMHAGWLPVRSRIRGNENKVFSIIIGEATDQVN